MTTSECSVLQICGIQIRTLGNSQEIKKREVLFFLTELFLESRLRESRFLACCPEYFAETESAESRHPRTMPQVLNFNQ